MAPRLPPPVEHRLIRRACSLGPRASRRLFGPPPRIDGQVLARDTNAILGLARLAGEDGFYDGRGTEEARANARAAARALAPHPAVAMASVRAIEVPGAAGPLPARLYRPFVPADGRALPLLLFFHGGGWVIGDLDTHDGLCRFLAATAGVAVLAIDYRLAPEHPFPAPLEDAWAATEWTLANAGELGADPARVAVGGDSAGGNMAAGVSVMARDGGGAAPAMQLLIYPVTDTAEDPRSRRLFAEGFILTKADMDKFEAAYLPDGVDPADPRISILKCPDLRGVTPAYVTTAGFDPLRDEGEAYAGKLRAAGVPTALRRHPGLVHTFANQTAVSPTARAAMLEAAGALRMGLAAAD